MELPNRDTLIDIARRTLLDDIVPGLDGDGRFKALMIANALAIALRVGGPPDIADAARALGDPAELSAAIRSGRLDPGTPNHAAIAAALLALAEAKCRVSNPKALSPTPTD